MRGDRSVSENYMNRHGLGGPMERRLVRREVDERPLRLAMQRMRIPLRRIRQNFETRDVNAGGLYGKLWWRAVDGARIGGFFGFITNPARWAHIGPEVPEAIVLAFVRPRQHAIHRRLVSRRGSLFDKVARQSRYEGVPFELFRDREEALLRHRSMRGRPDEILALSACDFFMASFRAFWASDFLQEIQKVRGRRTRPKGR
jgi:hypothetical protein